jgi:hypothetical protein
VGAFGRERRQARRLRGGIVLYAGHSALCFGRQMFAEPIAELWAARK